MNNTSHDHEFREKDAYAFGKYFISIEWLNTYVGTKSKLVNIGCGAGDFSLIARSAGYHVVGYEPDVYAASLAKIKAAGDSAHEVRIGSLKDVLANEQGVKLVVMHDVLEHISDDQQAVKQLGDILPSGGHLLLSVPAGEHLFGLHDEELGHYRRYSKSILLSLLEREFEIIRARYYGFLFIPVTLLFSCLMRKPYPKPDGKRGFAYWVIQTLVSIEKRMTPPLGTSLIVLARRR